MVQMYWGPVALEELTSQRNVVTASVVLAVIGTGIVATCLPGFFSETVLTGVKGIMDCLEPITEMVSVLSSGVYFA